MKSEKLVMPREVRASRLHKEKVFTFGGYKLGLSQDHQSTACYPSGKPLFSRSAGFYSGQRIHKFLYDANGRSLGIILQKKTICLPSCTGQ